MMGIAFFEAFEEQGTVIIDSGAQRPLRRPLKIHFLITKTFIKIKLVNGKYEPLFLPFSHYVKASWHLI